MRRFPAWSPQLRSFLFKVLLMFLLLLFCYSPAEQYISFPHVNSWLHIHSPREDCRKQLPVNSDDALRCSWSDMSLWIRPQFLRPGGQHVVVVQTASSCPCMSCIPTSLSKLSFHCVLPDEGKKLQNNSKMKKKRKSNVHAVGCLFACIHIQHRLYLLLLFNW